MTATITPTTLRGDEYDVVADYADGHTPTQIARDNDLPLDRVTGILTRKCHLDRDQARQLVNGGATILTGSESPLTAPLPKPAAKANTAPRVVQVKPTPAKPTPPPEPVLTEPTAVDHVAASPPGRPNGAVPQPEPEPETTVDPVAQMLDDGIAAITERLRTLVASLVDAALDQQRAAAARHRVEQLQAELDAARAELDGAP